MPSSPFIDHVRIIESRDRRVAHRLADIFELMFGSALVLDEPNRRRIRRVARQTPTNGDVPPDRVLDRRTGELRELLGPGRRKPRWSSRTKARPALSTRVVGAVNAGEVVA